MLHNCGREGCQLLSRQGKRDLGMAKKKQFSTLAYTLHLQPTLKSTTAPFVLPAGALRKQRQQLDKLQPTEAGARTAGLRESQTFGMH